MSGEDRYTQCRDYFSMYKNIDAKQLWQQLGAAIPDGDESKPGVSQLATWIQTNVYDILQQYRDDLDTAMTGLMENWSGDGADEFKRRVDITLKFAKDIQEDAGNLKSGLNNVATDIRETQGRVSDPENIPDGWDFAVNGFLATGSPVVAVASGVVGWVTGDDREKEAHENLAREMAGLSGQYDVVSTTTSPSTEKPEDLPEDPNEPTATPTQTPTSSSPTGAPDTGPVTDPNTVVPPGGEADTDMGIGDDTQPDTDIGDGGDNENGPSDGLQSGGGFGNTGGLGAGGLGGAGGSLGGVANTAVGTATGAASPGLVGGPGGTTAGGTASPSSNAGSARPGMMGAPRHQTDEDGNTDERDTWLLEDEMVWDDGGFVPPPVLK